jgi:hypothetical protein
MANGSKQPVDPVRKATRREMRLRSEMGSISLASLRYLGILCASAIYRRGAEDAEVEQRGCNRATSFNSVCAVFWRGVLMIVAR